MFHKLDPNVMSPLCFTDLEYTYDKKNKTTFLMKVLNKIESKIKISGRV